MLFWCQTRGLNTRRRTMLNGGVLALCLVSACLAAEYPVDKAAAGKSSTRAEEYKLPGNLEPTHYDITLTPDFATDTFTGTVKIEANVKSELDTIIFHGNGITFLKANVKVENVKDAANPTEVQFEEPTYDKDKHFHQIKVTAPLQKDDVVKITINDYTGILGSTNKGFYIAKYTDTDGSEKKFATTQFESTSAREAFPCFDEPEWKATFTISIVRPTTYNSISNMPKKTTIRSEKEDTETDTFEISKKMSTYLVAFVVSELKAEAGDTTDNIHAVYGLSHLIDEGRGKYAQEKAAEVIKAMDDFVGIKYSKYMAKMDQVAIPDDYFSAGAMENWGLVTYKEKYLLTKDGLTTASERQNVLSIIGHEFAHQWFGNLATPKWWNVLWLSEGFATYFEQYTSNVVDSTMKMMDQFVTLVNHVALEADSADETRAMTADVGSPQDISNSFDRIAYQKSGAVIRMMEHILTTDIFKKGLTGYLTAKELQPAEPSDLWKAMQDIIDNPAETEKPPLGEISVADIMETWEKNEGYPVVTLSRNDEGVVTLKQERFLLNKATSRADPELWTIPITYATEDDPSFDVTTTKYWLKEQEGTTDIKVGTDKWIILNTQETGYYRVNYDENTWNLIIDYLNSDNYNKIHVLNRAQLIDDSFNLARSGTIQYNIPMRLCQYLSREKEYVPLYTFLKSIQFVNNHLVSTDNYDYFKAYVNEQLQAVYKALGTDDTDNHIDKLNRANAIAWLCKFEDESCMSDMHGKLMSLEAGASVVPDLQNAIYCGGMRLATTHAEEMFKKLYDLYNSNNVEYLEKGRILAGMGCSLDGTVLNMLMNAAIDKQDGYVIPEADKVSAFSAVYTSSNVGVDKALNFVVDNFVAVSGLFTADQLKTILNGIASRTSAKDHLDKLKGITSSDAGITTILTTATETIDANIKWADANLEKLNVWLAEYGSAGLVSISLSLLFGMLVILNVF